MLLNSLHLVNFRQHVDTHIAFERGLTGIIGPNGAGKSTILEAIAWALYGQEAARGKKETIRTQRAGPNARVRVDLDFELGGHRYRVVRGLSTAELFLDGSDSPVANSLSGVSEMLRRRLGMSREEFFNTYFTGQKQLDAMAAMSSTQRAQFLSRVLGYERLRVAKDLVRDKGKYIGAEASGKRSALPDAVNVERVFAESVARVQDTRLQLQQTSARREAASRAMESVGPRWTTAQAEREALQRVLSALQVGETEARGYARDSERLSRELADVAAAEEELGRVAEDLQPFSELGEEASKLDQLERTEERRKALHEAERSLAEEVRTLRERREVLTTAPAREEEAVVDLERQREMLELVAGELEAKRTEWVRDRQEAATKREQLLKQYAEVNVERERLVVAGEDGTCPTCERPLSDHFRNVLDHFDEQLASLKEDGSYYKSRIKQLETMPPEVRELDERRRATFEDVSQLERARTKTQLEVQELGVVTRDLVTRTQRLEQVQGERASIAGVYDATRHAVVRKELDRMRALDARATRLTERITRKAVLESERDRAAAGLANANNKVQELSAQRDVLAFSEASFAELRITFESATAELRTAELNAVKASADAAAAQSALERAEQSREQLRKVQADLEQLDKQRRLHDELDRAYTDLRSDLNMQLRPEIGDIASGFLSQLSEGRYDELELDDNYNLTVHEEGIPKPVISGGEQDIANLCLRLAISQMIADRAGQNFSLLVLDEIFGSLDEARRASVVELLRGLHDRFEQVILITHIEQVREGLDRVISVSYDADAGSSHVSVSQPGAVDEMLLDELIEAEV